MNISEKKFFWIVTIAVLLLTLIPHLIGWGRVITGDWAHYQAYNTYGAADTNVYFSYMNQARNGSILFENLFTSETQQPTLFHPLWLLGGWLGALTTLPTEIVFQIMRVLAGLFFLWVVYRFLRWLRFEATERRWAFITIALTSGLGLLATSWPDLGFNQIFYSTDLSVAESNTFSTLYHSPLFPLSQALIILTIQFFITSFKNQQKRSLWYSGLMVFILSIIHTYDLITVAAILTVYGLVMLLKSEINEPAQLWDYTKRGLLLIPFVIPAAMYFIFVLNKEPAIAGWITQNITLSPSIWAYLLGFGLLIPLAIVGIGEVIQRKDIRKMLLVTWLLTSVVLIYFPYLQIQRRLTSGLHIPLAILTGIGLWLLWKRLRQKNALLAITTIGLLAIGLVSTPAGVLIRDSVYLAQQEEDHPYFYTASEREIQQFLATTTGSGGIIYSHPWTGNELAGMGRRVFLGHGHQTLNWEHKRMQINSFFTTWTNNQRLQYFQDNNIAWLFYGPRERLLGPWDPATVPWLRPELRQADVTLYRVL